MKKFLCILVFAVILCVGAAAESTEYDSADLSEALVILKECGGEPDEERIRDALSKGGLNYYVTPKETDQIIRFVGAFVGYAVNLALNERLSYEDMLSLIG